MSKDDKANRQAAPEPMWLGFALRKIPGEGWALRAGPIREAQCPSEQTHPPNILAVVLGRIEQIVSYHRDTQQ